MEHCEKLGAGRSPPVRTLEEWEWLRKEVRAVSPDTSDLPNLWVSVTDRDIEDEWRDAYPPYDKIDTNVTGAWPWRHTYEAIANLGKDASATANNAAAAAFNARTGLIGEATAAREQHNCMKWYTSDSDKNCWSEVQCTGYGTACLLGCVINIVKKLDLSYALI